MPKRPRNPRKAAALLLIAAGVGTFGYLEITKILDKRAKEAVQRQLAEIEKTLEPELEYTQKIPARSSLSEVLDREGLTHTEVHDIVEASKPFRDLARVVAGTEYHIDREPAADATERAIGLRFKFSPFEHLVLQRRVDGAWRAHMVVDKVDSRLVTYGSEVTSSLWDSAMAAEMDPLLIVSLTEIFAWQVDFSREVQKGDRWRLSVEEKLVRGKRVGWGRIMAAEYENTGRVFSAVLHSQAGVDLGYFAPDGSSLRRIFLKSPLKFGRITSRFSRRRFHPVLKISRPHNGVDYGAPTGTPVMSVGDGRVASAGRRGGGGNTVTIRHNSVYQTNYLHLSRFAKGIRPGVNVRQGQLIGYVGSTGLATGPHLHFEFYVNGRYADPLGLKFPSADPVPSDHMKPFLAKSETLLKTLPSWDVSRQPASGPRLVATDLSRKVLHDFAPTAVAD